MLLIVTPLTRWRRKILAYDLNGYDAHGAFERVNEVFERNGERRSVNITLAHITTDQLLAWVNNNVRPNWWEHLTGRVNVELWRL